MPLRAEFVAAARKYLGIPFRTQGRSMRGMDCVGVFFCAAEDLGLRDREGAKILRTDSLNYGPQPTDESIQAECERRLVAKPNFSEALPGDVVTLRVPGVICHCAIVTLVPGNRLSISTQAVYALPMKLRNFPTGKVVETILGERWLKRVAGLFSVPGLT